jgi:hypothetical protein
MVLVVKFSIKTSNFEAEAKDEPNFMAPVLIRLKIMKLRVKNNSVRLRLTQSEVARLAETGIVEEAIEFGIEPSHRLIYRLKVASDAERLSAGFENNRITIFVPKQQAEEWIETSQVGIKAEQNIGEGKTLRLLIEKDFACLEQREGEDERDAFPHPLQGDVG